jgi:hypothetical protein
MAKFSFKIIKTLDAFIEHKKVIEPLLESHPDNSFCLAYDWLIRWTEVFLEDQDKLYVFTYFNEEKLAIGFFPFYLKHQPLGYQLYLLGTGEDEQSEVSSEYIDVIVNKQFRKALFSHFLSQLKKLYFVTDINITNVLDTAEVLTLFDQLKDKKWQKLLLDSGQRFFLTTDTENLICQIPNKGIKKQIRQYQSTHSIRVEHMKRLEELDDFFDELINIHTTAWQLKGKSGAFCSQQFIDFHKLYIQKHFAKNKILLFRLKAGSKTLAIFYGFIGNSTLYYYQSGINYNAPFKFLGAAMHWEAMRFACQHSLSKYDLMKGKANSYKTRWTRNTEQMSSVLFYNQNFMFLHYFRRLTSLLKRLLRRT